MVNKPLAKNGFLGKSLGRGRLTSHWLMFRPPSESQLKPPYVAADLSLGNGDNIQRLHVATPCWWTQTWSPRRNRNLNRWLKFMMTR